MNIFNLLNRVKNGANARTGNISIFKKLVITFVFIIIVPLIISFYVYQIKANNMIVSQLSSETMNSIDLVSKSIDSLLGRMTSIALYVNDDGSIKDIILQETQNQSEVSALSPENENLSKLNRINKFNNIISNIAFNMVGTRSYITIVTSSGQRYTNWAYEGDRTDLYLNQYLTEEKETSLVWKAVEKNYIESDATVHPYVITLVKNIFNSSGTRWYGTFIISIPESEISKLMSPDDKLQTRVILDENMQVISSTKKEWLTKSFDEIYDFKLPANQKGYFTFDDAKSGKLIISFDTIRNWKVVDIKSYDSVTKQMDNVRNQLLVVNAVFMLVFLGISVIIAQGITKPLRRLTNMMLSTDLESPYSERASKRYDEVGILENSFNVMRSNIKTLMQNNLDNERKKRDAELKSLQAQISPHFLFNTLNAVRWAAINNNTKKAADMVLALSNLLRMTVVKGDELITVEEEINNLKNYAAIFQMRHSIEFQLSCNVEEDVLQYKIPKLLLQPLAENAIIHGFKGITYKGSVEITSCKKEGFVILCVKDNGVGFNLNSPPEEEDIRKVKFSGIGIKNVDERIKLYFGEKYGLNIISNLGEGTVIEVRLPEQSGMEG